MIKKHTFTSIPCSSEANIFESEGHLGRTATLAGGAVLVHSSIFCTYSVGRFGATLERHIN